MSSSSILFKFNDDRQLIFGAMKEELAATFAQLKQGATSFD